MRAIVGVDGSEGGWEAVRQTAAILSPEKDKVVFYYSPPKVKLSGARANAQLVAQARENLANAIFDEASLRLPDAFRDRAARIVGEQAARRGLKIAADQAHAGLIAVGARGLGSMVGMLLGSVTRSVLRGTTTPILVARPMPVRQDRSKFHVLWAVDDVPATRAPIELIEQLTWPAGATGVVMHVVDPLLGMEVPTWFEERVGHDEEFSRAWSEEYDADKRQKFNELAEFSATLPRPFGALPILAEGNPAVTILKQATTEHTDLIIVATRDLGVVQRFVLGSTAETLVQYAPCSVLIVHSPMKP